MKNLATQLLETCEITTNDCTTEEFESNAFYSIRSNLAEAQKYASQGKFDRAQVFASIVQEDSLQLLKDLKDKETNK